MFAILKLTFVDLFNLGKEGQYAVSEKDHESARGA